MSEDEGERRGGLVFRRGASFSEIARPGDDTFEISTPNGTSKIPMQDASIYAEMMAAISALDTLANKMNKLKEVGENTRKIIRSARLLAVDLREEIERRVR